MFWHCLNVPATSITMWVMNASLQDDYMTDRMVVTLHVHVCKRSQRDKGMYQGEMKRYRWETLTSRHNITCVFDTWELHITKHHISVAGRNILEGNSLFNCSLNTCENVARYSSVLSCCEVQWFSLMFEI